MATIRTKAEVGTGGCTQMDLARLLGVSQMTVHRALTGHPAVKPETRRKIETLAAQHGYRLHSSARAMQSGRFGCAALLLSIEPYRSNLPQALLDGIYNELAAHNLHLTLARLPDEKLTDAGIVPKILREWLADGLLIDYTGYIPARMMELLRKHHLPAVWINSQQEADCVYPDDGDAGWRATEHLLQLGHRRVAYVDFTNLLANAGEHYSARDRREGYLAAMQRADLEPRLIEDARVDAGQRLPYLKKSLAGAGHPTALVCYGNQEVEIAVVAATALGLKVPRDLSVMTFAAPGAAHAGLALTIMAVPEYEVGQKAAVMLLEKIEKPGQVMPPTVVPFRFEAGQTCATPRAGKKTGRKTKIAKDH